MGVMAAIGWRLEPPCRRCSSRTTKRSPWRSRCGSRLASHVAQESAVRAHQGAPGDAASPPVSGQTVATATVSATPRDGVIDPETLTALAAAAAKGERVRLGCADRHGRTTTRHVEPVRLVAPSRHWHSRRRPRPHGLADLQGRPHRRTSRHRWPSRTSRASRGGDAHLSGRGPGRHGTRRTRGTSSSILSLTDAETRLRDSIGDGRIEAWAHVAAPGGHARRHRAMARLTDPAPGLRVRSLRPPESSRYLRALADRIVRAVSK